MAPQELSSLRRAMALWLADADNGLSLCFRDLLDGLWRDLRTLDKRIDEVNRTIGISFVAFGSRGGAIARHVG